MKKKTLRTAAVVLSLVMSVSSVNVMGQVEMSSKTTTDDTKNAVVELEDLIKDMEDAKNETSDLESSLIGLKEKLTDDELKLSKDEAALATAKQKLAQAEEKYDALNIFTDVEKGSYYYDAVLWCVTKNIINGTTPNTFSPKDDCTRAQVVMFLWRAAGSPLVTIDENPFIDVTSSFKNFEKAILWAYENGISTGKTATTFQPNLNCSRANVVAFLYRGRLL